MFYAILAVGLAISWAQVGKRAQLKPNANLHIMSIEEDCQPYRAPCGAYASEFGLVLGPDSGRANSGLRMQGVSLPDSIEFDVSQLDGGALEMEKPLFMRLSDNAWRVQPLPREGRLRINVLHQGKQWMAEFPLQ